MITKLIKFVKKNYLYILCVLIVVSITMVLMKEPFMEYFTVIDLVVPPLKQISCDEYAYGCPINGYRCTPTMIYICLLQGQTPQENMKYVKYKIIDKDNVVHYSGLYKNIEGLKIGSYVVMDNGQEFYITSLDTDNDQPADCPAIRKDPAEFDKGALRMI